MIEDISGGRRDGRDDGDGRDRRPPRENSGRGGRRWDRGDGNGPRAAMVKFSNPEDAHAAWRLRHGRRYRFGPGEEGPTPTLVCKILE